MAADWNRLLEYIVTNLVVPAAGREAQLDATAVQDVESEINSIEQRQGESANRLAAPFARGLEMALNTAGPLQVDDTTGAGSAIADAFSRYLVATNLATSTSSEIGGGNYAYAFEVDWQQVKNVARRAGVGLSFDRDGSNEA